MFKFLIDMKINEKFDWLWVPIIEMAYSLVKKNGNKMGYMYWKVNKKHKQEHSTIKVQLPKRPLVAS